ncbi:MAG: hypothetical protein IJL20_14540 [Lachnospiraceae bacterium]|nr:hypothetical protein [Lachnospiraceae bacterium]
MSRKSLLFMCAFILCLVVCALLDGEYAVKAKAVTGEADNVTVDISGLREKMQAGAVFTGVEYDGDLYFISDAKLYKYTAEQAKTGKEPTLVVNNAQSFRIDNDAIFYTKSYGNAVYRINLSDGKTTQLSKEKYGVCLTDFHTDGYFYLWDNNKFYRVSETDGTRILLAKYSGNYGLYNRGRSVCFFKDRFFYSCGFKSENGTYASYPYSGKTCDYKICSKNLDGTGRKTVLNPKGANSEFNFYEIEGELFAVSGTDIYRYNEKKEKFKKVKNIEFPTYWSNDEIFGGKHTYNILGNDGTYLYLYKIITEIPDELKESASVRVDQCINTVDIYRVGADWKLIPIFSGVNIRVDQGYIINEDFIMYLDYADEDYMCIRFGDEDFLPLFIDREGNYLFSLGYFAKEDDIQDGYDADESTVTAKIRDGKVYVIQHDGGGRVAGVKIIPLEEVRKERLKL